MHKEIRALQDCEERTREGAYFEKLVSANLSTLNIGLILLFVGYLAQRWGEMEETRHHLSAGLILIALTALICLAGYARRFGGLPTRFHSRVLVVIVLVTSSLHALLGLEPEYSNVVLLMVVGLGLILLDPRAFIQDTLLVLFGFALMTPWVSSGPDAWTERIFVGVSPLLGWLFLQNRRSLFREQLASVEREERRRRELRWTLQASEARRAVLERLLEERAAQTDSARKLAAARRAQNVELAKVVHRFGEPDPLGRLAGGVAHDFCSLLMIFAHGLAELAPRARGAFAQEAMASAEHALGEMESVVGALLTYCQEQTLEFEPLQLKELLDDFVRYFASLLPERVVFEAQVLDSDRLVWADRRQIQQALLNLCLNAWEAMPSGGSITLAVEPKGSVIELSVSDTGSGLPVGYEDQIFEPFFTEKPFHEGRGLGLSSVKGIVGQHGGRVWVKASGPTGTTISFVLPVYRPDSGAEQRLLLVRDPNLRRALEGTHSKLDPPLEEAETVAELQRRLRPGSSVLVEYEALRTAERAELEALISGHLDPARWLILGAPPQWRGLSEQVVVLEAGAFFDPDLWDAQGERAS